MHCVYYLLLSHHSDPMYEEGQCNFVVLLFYSELSTLIPGTKIPTNCIKIWIFAGTMTKFLSTFMTDPAVLCSIVCNVRRLLSDTHQVRFRECSSFAFRLHAKVRVSFPVCGRKCTRRLLVLQVMLHTFFLFFFLGKQLFLGNLQGQLHTAHQITETKQLKWQGINYNAMDTPNDGSRENHNASNATETPRPAPKRRRNLVLYCIYHSSLTHIMQEPNRSYNVMALTLSGLSIPDPWQWSNSPQNDSPKKNAVSANVQLNNPTPLIVQEPT